MDPISPETWKANGNDTFTLDNIIMFVCETIINKYKKHTATDQVLSTQKYDNEVVK